MFYDGPLHEYYSEYLEIEGYEQLIEPDIELEKAPEIQVPSAIRSLHQEINHTRNEMNGYYQNRNELYYITRFVKETNHVYMKQDLIDCLENMKMVWEANLFSLKELVYRFQLHMNFKPECKLNVKSELITSIVFQMVGRVMENDLEGLKFKNFQLFKHLQTESTEPLQPKVKESGNNDETMDSVGEPTVSNEDNTPENYEIEDKIEFHEMQSVLESLFTKPAFKTTNQHVNQYEPVESGLLEELALALKKRNNRTALLQ
ncbi:hypothetical protein HDV06_004888 [Boothiomyces sp. JEL0866]|nr:hypothetical protein HDV06_004888 [Boothiomyces sp. JEL0866]